MGNMMSCDDEEPLEAAACLVAEDIPDGRWNGRMTICTYNIFEGLNGREPRRVAKFQQWLATRGFDVVTLNEVNGFEQADLARIAAAAGFRYCHVHKARRTGFHLGILSRHPIRVLPTSGMKMHHGLLHATVHFVGGPVLHVLATHLIPFETHKRRKEIENLLAYVEEFGLMEQPLVLLGDLNALSPGDVEVHDHRRLTSEVLRHNKSLERKFLSGGESVDYEPLQLLYASGFQDLGQGDPRGCSVPTAVNTDPDHAARMRLDYALLSPGLAAQLSATGNVQTVADAETNDISDHFPVTLELRLA